MKTLTLALSCVVMLTACTTPSTVESRKKERASAYGALSREDQAAADQGQLRAGMKADAAYVAWGKPTKITSEGTTTTWLYQEKELKEHESTTVRGQYPEKTTVLYPNLVTRAKIVFTNGLVKEWQRFDRPTY